VTLDQWASDYNIPQHAIDDLRRRIHSNNFSHTVAEDPLSEEAVQSNIRLEAGRKGIILWRNNVGALKDMRGIPIRFGLANESKQQNERIKSSDLIGIRPLMITQAHVGRVIGQFVSVEVKKQSWKWRGKEHEQAQLRWLELVLGYGGYGMFANTHEGVF